MDRYISVFDTSISSLNVGDSIIMDAVNEEIDKIFADSQHIRIPSHEKISLTSLSIIRRSRSSIVGGSNILSSYMNKYRQWRLDMADAFFVKEKITLMGVGWRQYQGNTNYYTKTLLRRVLKRSGLHSVRDSYTEQKLREIGIVNVINTGCPTMWCLSEAHCAEIPQTKARSIIFTLTDYNRSLKHDTLMIEALRANYDKVYFWVQGSKDFQYFNSFGTLIKDIKVVPPNLKAYNQVLENNDIDYTGTRLHAGIRALQKKRRTIIVGIDNRAEEKRKDFGLPVLDRKNIEDLNNWINTPFETRISLPDANIKRWKDQIVDS